MRVFNRGSYYRVTCSMRDVEAFNAQWPGSGINTPVSFTFHKGGGDLVDMSPSKLDGPEVLALSHDAQDYGKKRLNLNT